MDPAIPVLDLPDPSPVRGDATAFAAALRDAFERVGFVGIRRHGIPDGVIAAAQAAARAFFALPAETKRRYEIAGGAGQRGATRFGVERARDQAVPDRKEFFHVGREVPPDDPLAATLRPNVWPAEVPGFAAAELALFRALEALGARLLAAVARALGLPDDWFAPRIVRGNSILRLICYPPLTDGTGVGGVRAAAHEDINLLTLLVGSEEPGLEIRTRDGRWIAVTTIPGTIVCNVGDMLQRLTNGVLVSTTHRVVNPPAPWDARPRHSIPFFLHFNPDVVIRTLPSCISAARPERWPEPITADAYLQQRLREIGLLPGGATPAPNG